MPDSEQFCSNRKCYDIKIVVIMPFGAVLDGMEVEVNW